MRKKTTFFMLLSLFFAAGCNKNADKPVDQEKTTPAPASASQPLVLGKALAGAEQVSVADLLANPNTYDGKTVRLEGKIEDFCHHKRAWFGIGAKDGKGMLRVFCAPRFQAPADCLGKQVVAEGKVELNTIPAEQVAHYGKEHKFLDGVKVEPGKPVVLPIVRAFGAEIN
jgi:hypothetical protein